MARCANWQSGDPQKVVNVGSNPTRVTVAEAEVVEVLGCDPRGSEFESRRSPQPSLV